MSGTIIDIRQVATSELRALLNGAIRFRNDGTLDGVAITDTARKIVEAEIVRRGGEV